MRSRKHTFEEPGRPTIIRGVLDKRHTSVMKRFSIRPCVEAMPGGIVVAAMIVCMTEFRTC